LHLDLQRIQSLQVRVRLVLLVFWKCTKFSGMIAKKSETLATHYQCPGTIEEIWRIPVIQKYFVHHI